QTRREADDQQPTAGVAEGRHRRIEPVRMARARILAELHEPRTERTVAIGLGSSFGFSLRSRRHRPLAQSWSRAAGIAARDDVARAGAGVPTDRGRVSTAIPRDR